MQAKKAVFYTLGCRVNQYESDAMAEKLEAAGFTVVKSCASPDLLIVNTCTVTAESDRKCGQLIRRLAKKYPGTPIIAAGCMAQLKPEKLLADYPVQAVIGNSMKGQIADVARSLVEPNEKPLSISENDIARAPYDNLTLTAPRRCRSYIKIEDGCENRCAYCTIPMARGKIRSKDQSVILEEIRCLANQGCEEFILTGIETASYGRDTGESLGTLLSLVDALPGVKRIGLGSLEPNLFSERFLSQIAPLSHLLPHFHLSIQSGSSGVLRRMRRPYNATQALSAIARIRAALPEAQLTADLITGFPGETEEEFNETLAFCREARFLHIHIFPYSNRKGTEADQLTPQVPSGLRHERAARLEAVQKEIKASLLAEYVEKHRTAPVWILVEEPYDKRYFGHTEHYVDTVFTAEEADVLQIIPVLLDHTDGVLCYGHKMEVAYGK